VTQFQILLLSGLLLFFAILPPARGTGEEYPREIETSFLQFKNKWFDKLRKHCSFGRDKIKVVDENGRYLATYRTVGPDINYTIKKTDHKETPYVAILKYTEKEYIAEGDSPEMARQGPFRCSKTELVTEIFPYTRGTWHY